VTGRRKPRLVDSPMALASDGTPLLNVTHLVDVDDPVAAVRRLLADGHTLFIGVTLPTELRREHLREVHDVLADAVGRLGPRLRVRKGAR